MTAVKKTTLINVILTDAETKQMLHEKLQAQEEKHQKDLEKHLENQQKDLKRKAPKRFDPP